MIKNPSRRAALAVLVTGALGLGACGRRGGLEVPGPTPSPIGGPTPPTPPRAQAAADPARAEPRVITASDPAQGRPQYDPPRPVGRNPMLPSGRFILDPLL